MSIRILLLLSFLGLSFLASALLTGLAFVASRATLEREITLRLQSDAATLMEQVDLLMFERLQNIHSWSHLEVMQEARIGDIDKRLARFLAESKQGYGDVYRELYYVDNNDRIVAASEPPRIGQSLPPPLESVGVLLPNGEAMIDMPDLQPPYTEATLTLRAAIPDSYTIEDIGHICGSFDLHMLFRLFDEVAQSSAGERYIALLDTRGRLLAASYQLRQRQLLMTDQFAAWRPNGDATFLSVRAGSPAFDSQALAGYAKSAGFQGYSGTGWSVLIMQPADKAFMPIHSLWWLFCISFAFTAFCAGVAAHVVAGRLSRPLLELTEWARSFSRAEDCVPPEIGATPELRALSKAFRHLVANLDKSRLQVARAAKLAVIGEMAAIMAHEVRTPLGILHSTAQMLERDDALPAKSRDMTRMILEETQRLSRLISTLLECARPRPPKIHPHDIHEIINRALDLLQSQAQKKQIRFTLEYRAAPAVVPCDSELMVQVFLNLILNSVQFVGMEGHIVLSTSRVFEGLKVSICDDGPGIPPEAQGRVFDPFFTTRKGGIGLGLTVTQQIVATHGGSLSIENGKLGGACFTLILPNTPETFS